MKFCKDCKHMWQLVDMLPMCYHPLAPVEPVYGQKDAPCSHMRSANFIVNHCGPEAHWFEPIEGQQSGS